MHKIARNKPFVLILFPVYILIVIKLIFFKAQIGSITYQHIAYNRSTYLYMVRYGIVHSNLIPGQTITSFIKTIRNSKDDFGHYDSKEIEFSIQNIAGNVLLFLPMGLLLPLVLKLKWNWKTIVLSLFIISLSCEITQVLTVRGFFDVDDIILNTIGGMIGYAILCKAQSLPQQRPTTT